MNEIKNDGSDALRNAFGGVLVDDDNQLASRGQLLVKDRHLSLPAHENMRGTSFGNYEFKASQEGFDPFYGILPLSFKGGHLAADILLFAPGAFFNLRAVFPFYEIDVEKGLIRYRASENEAWNEYSPKAEEGARARGYFEGASSDVPAAGSK